jgi:hypothetical protein
VKGREIRAETTGTETESGTNIATTTRITTIAAADADMIRCELRDHGK